MLLGQSTAQLRDFQPCLSRSCRTGFLRFVVRDPGSDRGHQLGGRPADSIFRRRRAGPAGDHLDFAVSTKRRLLSPFCPPRGPGDGEQAVQVISSIRHRGCAALLSSVQMRSGPLQAPDTSGPSPYRRATSTIGSSPASVEYRTRSRSRISSSFAALHISRRELVER